MFQRVVSLGLAVGVLAPAALVAQEEGSFAALFAYELDRGANSDFAAGYRRHLDWHRTHRDSLAWYGWFVLTGDSPGMFVDGVFGIGLGALDARVDPAGDGADAAANVSPFASPVYRKLLRRVGPASPSATLEERRPSRFLTVFRISTTAAGARRLEAALAAGVTVRHALYAVIDGGELFEYLLLAPHDRWADLEDGGLRRRLREALGGGDSEVGSAVWQYREELSYLP